MGGLSQFLPHVLVVFTLFPLLVMVGWLLVCAYLRRKDALS
jgi:hypothetical protein